MTCDGAVILPQLPRHLCWVCLGWSDRGEASGWVCVYALRLCVGLGDYAVRCVKLWSLGVYWTIFVLDEGRNLDGRLQS